MVGRFITEDPINGLLLFPQSQNPYQYVLNNSVNHIDPYGLVALVDDALFWATVGIVAGIGVYYSWQAGQNQRGGNPLPNVNPFGNFDLFNPFKGGGGGPKLPWLIGPLVGIGILNDLIPDVKNPLTNEPFPPSRDQLREELQNDLQMCIEDPSTLPPAFRSGG